MVEPLERGYIESLRSPLARVVEVHGALGSTQERARELAHFGAPHGTLIVAEIQKGAVPFGYDPANPQALTVKLNDQASKDVLNYWADLAKKDLVGKQDQFTTDYISGVVNGKYATYTSAAWAPGYLTGAGVGKGDSKGVWAVAPLPQWEEGANASAENGGSSLAVPAASTQQELAYAFIEYANAGDGVGTRLDAGAFPATVADLESEEFLNTEFEYFGGQRANEIFAESAANVVDGWSYLPYQVYANSIFNDTVGQAYVSDISLAEGLADWQQRSVEYGTEQGFTITD